MRSVPRIETAIAGAEIAVAHEASGPDRFATCSAWSSNAIQHTIAVGDVGAPFGGPHFFAGFAFDDEPETGDAFPAAYVFVPRWQVALAGTTTTAVANLLGNARCGSERARRAGLARAPEVHAIRVSREYGRRKWHGRPSREC